MSMGKPVVLGVLAALLLAPCCLQAQIQVFSEDPIPGSTSPFISNTFMQLDSISPGNLHTAVDVTASIGDPVYPPVEPSSTCVVVAIEDEAVVLLASQPQNGDRAVCKLLHMDPNANLVLNSLVGASTLLGGVNTGHLHFELFLSADGDVGDADLRNPQRYSLANAPWNADSTTPEITENTVVHTAPVGSMSVWQVWVADPAEGSDPVCYTGIGGMQLLIDNAVVDEFDFDALAGKNGWYPPSAVEFYYSLTPPSGYNNPNTLQYRLNWVTPDDLEHVWRLRWWDARGNYDEGDPEHPPGAPLLAGEMGGDIWFEGGVMKTAIRWRVSYLGEVEHFDVLRGADSDGSYTRANLEPIPAVDGQLDYEFADTLPEGWTNVWYALAAKDSYGNSYEMGRTHLATDTPASAGISLYPNPSRGAFVFQVDTPRDSEGSLAIYNAAGRRVRTLHEGNMRSGTCLWNWDGRNTRGDLVGQGVYFVRLATEAEVVLQKLTVIR